MATLTISVKRTQTLEAKKGVVSIKVKSSGNVLASSSENFPLETSNGYILDVLLDKAKSMMRELAMKRIPMNFSFDVDSDQMRNRAVFNL